MNFDQIREKAESQNGLLTGSKSVKIYIASTPENASGREIADIFFAGIKKQGIDTAVIRAGSFGYYDIEPVIIIEKPGRPAFLYKNADAKTAQTLIDGYLANDNPCPDIAFCMLGTDKIENIPSADSLPLFSLQKRIALRNCGYVDPENINHCILRGGYSGLAGALKKDRISIIDDIKKSGLRGRGGAGYSTADKLKACLDTSGDEKYLICNAIDSDPKSLNARLLLTSDPHSFLEGMIISAYAAGASRCILYIDSEYDPAVQILEKAVLQMKEYGLLGSSILDSDFTCEIEIKRTKRSIVSGEETALLRFLEDKQSMPYMRPPYPETKGLKGKPAVICNIETCSNISAVFQLGPEIISGSGTGNSKGTKIITYFCKDRHNYSIEVPFGTSLRTIIEKMEGNEQGDIKAVQFGGPTGAYLNGDTLDITIDYDYLRDAGLILGSGTIEIIYKDKCAVEMTRDLMSYLHDQSCGKCVFCREGTFQISDILEDISKGEGKPQDIGLINEICGQMKNGTICGFGLTAADPVLSAIKLFGNEFDVHIKENRCPLKGNNQ